MSFWDSVGETISSKGKEVGETISLKGKEVADKAKVLADIASIKGQISSCESVVNKNYHIIGKAYYEVNKDDFIGIEFEENCKAIADAYKAIRDLQERLRELKGTAVCSQCGAEIAANSIYCSKCGVKLEKEAFDEDDIIIDDEVTADPTGFDEDAEEIEK